LRQPRQALGGRREAAERDVNFARQRQRAHVLGIERLHLLERAPSALAIAELALGARAFPE
jgi:hypothetical protein